MKDFLKSLFGASSKEITGFSALIIILLVSLSVPWIVDRITAKDDSHWHKDEIILDSLVILLAKQQKSLPTEAVIPHDLHIFNPNKATYSELQSLGFSDKISQRIINYRQKGGFFSIRNDLYKIYDIDSTLVDKLYNYIDLPKQLPKTEIRQKPAKEAEKKFESVARAIPLELPDFDINDADTATLQTIKGIGSVLSKRIIDFRDNLGGFIADNQLYEVYNLDSTVVLSLLSKMYIENNFIPRKLFINMVDEEDLAAHPYISWQQARLIIAYRNQHGDFKSAQDLLKVYAINENDIDRIVSYLDWTPAN